MPPQSALITVMMNAARKASIRLKRDYGEVDQLQVSKKGPADFVTAADIRTEKLLREELLARPSFGFLMEEAGEQLEQIRTEGGLLTRLMALQTLSTALPNLPSASRRRKTGRSQLA